MASPSAILVYPAIAFTVSSLLFLGNTTARTFPKLGSNIKANIGFNPLKFFEAYPDVSLAAAGVGIVAGRAIVPAIAPGSMVSPTGVTIGITAVVLGLIFTVLMAPARSKDNVINQIGKINALLEDSGKDLSALLEINNGKFKAKDETLPQAKEIARLLNKVYEQIYIYKGEENFKQLAKALGGDDGIKAATSLLNCENIQSYTDSSGKNIDDRKTIVNAKEKLKKDIQAAKEKKHNQKEGWALNTNNYRATAISH